MERTRILGLAVSNRQDASLQVQGLLTKYGCSIKTRIGMHEVSGKDCSRSGLIMIELTGDLAEQEKLETGLRDVQGVQVQKMDFELS